LADLDISIRLTKRQIAGVVRRAARQEGVSSLALALRGLDRRASLLSRAKDSKDFSRTLLRALLVLSAFSPDGTKRRVTDVARQLDLTVSVTARYVATWVTVGVLERDAESRQYGRVKVS
jgi:hypothetical protein